MFQIKIRVITPKGKATSTNKFLGGWLLPFGVKATTEINASDNQILWLVNCNAKQLYKINRNVGTYDVIIKNIFESKMLKKRLPKLLSEKDLKELKTMLKEQTKVEILRAVV